MYTLDIIVPGQAKDIVAMAKGRHNLCRDYLNSLDVRALKKMIAVMQRMADTGQVHNTSKFRHLRDGIYEFKAQTARILCFFHQDYVICTHGTEKTKRQHLENEINKARDYRKQYLENRR
jgi:hypothetical protein